MKNKKIMEQAARIKIKDQEWQNQNKELKEELKKQQKQLEQFEVQSPDLKKGTKGQQERKNSPRHVRSGIQDKFLKEMEEWVQKC